MYRTCSVPSDEPKTQRKSPGRVSKLSAVMFAVFFLLRELRPMVKQVFREGFPISKVALEMDMFDVELSPCRRISCLFDWKVFIGYPVDLQVSWPRGEAAKGESHRKVWIHG